MALYDLLPWLAAALLIGWMVAAALNPNARLSWIAPAMLGAAFLGWSAYAIAVEGPLGFWQEHTRNAWGNQIWFDLLIGTGAAWTLLMPQARAVGMRPVPWTLFVLASGGIGLLAMLSRCMYLRDRARVSAPN